MKAHHHNQMNKDKGEAACSIKGCRVRMKGVDHGAVAVGHPEASLYLDYLPTRPAPPPDDLS